MVGNIRNEIEVETQVGDINRVVIDAYETSSDDVIRKANRGHIALGYILRGWNRANAVFIPKMASA